MAKKQKPTAATTVENTKCALRTLKSSHSAGGSNNVFVLKILGAKSLPAIVKRDKGSESVAILAKVFVFLEMLSLYACMVFQQLRACSLTSGRGLGTFPTLLPRWPRRSPPAMALKVAVAMFLAARITVGVSHPAARMDGRMPR